MEIVLEAWNDFIGKTVRVIVDDRPSQYPKHKDGVIKAFTPTHLLLLQNDKVVALLLNDIRRIESRKDGSGWNGTKKR